MTNGSFTEFVISNIVDSAGNISPDTTILHRVFIQQPVVPGDVLINELLIDPEPAELLPASEYIELWNRSGHPQQLDAWSISDAVSSVEIPPYILMPDSFVVLVPEKNTSLFEIPVLPLSKWLSLNNSADSLTLYYEGMPAHHVYYNSSSFDSLYDDGRAIELLNPHPDCPDRWATADIHLGGSPGNANTVNSLQQEMTMKLEQTNTELYIYTSLPTSFIKQNESHASVNGQHINIHWTENSGLLGLPQNSGRYTAIINLLTCAGDYLVDSLAFVVDNEPPMLVSSEQVGIDKVLVAFNERVVITDSTTVTLSDYDRSI